MNDNNTNYTDDQIPESERPVTGVPKLDTSEHGAAVERILNKFTLRAIGNQQAIFIPNASIKSLDMVNGYESCAFSDIKTGSSFLRDILKEKDNRYGDDRDMYGLFLSSTLHKKVNGIALALWTIDHFGDPALGFTDEEWDFLLLELNKHLKDGLFEEVCHGTSQEAMDFATYFFLRLQSASMNKLGKKISMEDYFATIVGASEIAVEMSAKIDRSASEIIHGNLVNIAGSQPMARALCGELLKGWGEKWKIWKERRDAMQEEYLASYMDNEEETDFVAEIENQATLISQISIVSSYINPDSLKSSPDAKEAWDYPVHYLSKKAADKKEIYFRAFLGDKVMEKESFPKAWDFQLAWLAEMGQQSVSNWLIKAELGLYSIKTELSKAGDHRSENELCELLQEYLSRKPGQKDISLPTFLSLPESIMHKNEIINSLEYWKKLRMCKETAGATVTVLPTYESDEMLEKWREVNKGKRYLIVGAINQQFNDESSYWIEQTTASPYSNKNEFQIKHVMRNKVYEIGTLRGMGEDNAVAIPIRENEKLLNLFNQGNPLHDEMGNFCIYLTKFRKYEGAYLKNGDVNPEVALDAMVFVSEDDNDNAEGPWVPDGVTTNNPNLVPSGK